jgi:D-alanyl-D-alanine carboxypeptidase/D-alanyl-D-alanine-endopeptidase (penicillin-binding protein 4)
VIHNRLVHPTRHAAAVLAALVVGVVGTPAVAAPVPVQAPPKAGSALVPAVPVPQRLGANVTTTTDQTPRIVAKLNGRMGAGGLTAAFSGRVSDDHNRTIWERGGTTTRMPASTMKLVTAVTALRSIGKDTRFTTPLLQDPRYRSSLYLKGVGDPRLTSGNIATMAAAAATSLKAQGILTVNVKVDDSLFPAPTLATGWKSSYLPGDVAPVRALVVDSRDVADTSLDAGAILTAALRARGIGVRSLARLTAPSGSTQLTSITSTPLSSIVGSMLNVSQNDYAEILLRVAAIRRGRPATWSGATANAVTVLRENGVGTYGFVMRDGSGLSRSDRMPTATLTSLLFRVALDPDLTAVMLPRTALPVAGQTGTLASRFKVSPYSCAAGRVHAKTGSLADVVTLAGYAEGTDGVIRPFAFLINGVTSPKSSRLAVDLFATTTTGCY